MNTGISVSWYVVVCTGTDCVECDSDVMRSMRFPVKPTKYCACVIELHDALNEPNSAIGGKLKDVIPIDAVWYIIMQYF